MAFIENGFMSGHYDSFGCPVVTKTHVTSKHRVHSDGSIRSSFRSYPQQTVISPCPFSHSRPIDRETDTDLIMLSMITGNRVSDLARRAYARPSRSGVYQSTRRRSSYYPEPVPMSKRAYTTTPRFDALASQLRFGNHVDPVTCSTCSGANPDGTFPSQSSADRL